MAATAGLDREFYLRERYLGTRERSRALSAFYAVKPAIPRRVQLALRRRYATRQARREFPRWPIEPILVEHEHDELRRRLATSGAERLPMVGYWPEGRRFACALTHDVEGVEGVRNVRRVLDIERRHGFVSAWNFVAEWYPIEPGVFDEIRAAGGEIGLHAVKHDGKLFESREAFEAELPKIHRYLREWGAVGFRSPATHRNADWMHELGCLYDSSFPDTDPYEPQPGGCCSIFPFLLDGLVELPLTLVQDHTLWEILRERSIDAWVRKSEWIIANHGLIVLNVHPDYLDSPERLALYEQFLVWLREQQGGWLALPRDVASWWRDRERLRIEPVGDDGARVTGGAASTRATVAWVSEAEGGIALDLGPAR